MTSAFDIPTVPRADSDLPSDLELGAFSVSLDVADLGASTAFYEKLGFVVAGGDPAHDYLILKNGETTIGLFHGVFDGSILTFNPGLTNRMERLESYTDIRQIQTDLEAAGVEMEDTVDPGNPSGPASITLTDPDGNAILIDQFF